MRGLLAFGESSFLPLVSTISFSQWLPKARDQSWRLGRRSTSKSPDSLLFTGETSASLQLAPIHLSFSRSFTIYKTMRYLRSCAGSQSGHSTLSLLRTMASDTESVYRGQPHKASEVFLKPHVLLPGNLLKRILV